MSNDLIAKVKAVGAVMQRYQTAVADFDREVARILAVNATDLRCLEVLLTPTADETTPRELATALHLTTGSVTTMLDRLERAGYVVREPHASDRRKTVVRTTALARERAWGLMGPFLQEAEAEVTAGFTAEELEVVERFATHATAVQERHTDRLRSQAVGGRNS